MCGRIASITKEEESVLLTIPTNLAGHVAIRLQNLEGLFFCGAVFLWVGEEEEEEREEKGEEELEEG